MSRRTDAHKRIRDDLAHHTPQQVSEAIQRLMDARPAATGAASYDGARGGGGSSSTEVLALAPDRVAPEIKRLDDALNRMLNDARTVRDIIDSWTPRQPSDRERREVERANTPDDGCQHHATADLYEPATHEGTVAGNLDLPMALCDFCYWQVYRKGRLPRGEVLVHRQVTGKDPRERAS